MTEHTAHEALAAWLINTTVRPVCTNLACRGCELPHLQDELRDLLEGDNPTALATAAVDLLRDCHAKLTPSKLERLMEHLQQLMSATPSSDQ